MGELDGKVAIVTGAGVIGGLGTAGARAVAREGARVVLTDLERTAVADVPGTGSLAEVTASLREGQDGVWGQHHPRGADRRGFDDGPMTP